MKESLRDTKGAPANKVHGLSTTGCSNEQQGQRSQWYECRVATLFSDSPLLFPHSFEVFIFGGQDGHFACFPQSWNCFFPACDLWTGLFQAGRRWWLFHAISYRLGTSNGEMCRCSVAWNCAHDWSWFTNERRAKTHERFYMIEVHRHRFARHARKVPFEKCEHWRKVCERSTKDQIVSTL